MSVRVFVYGTLRTGDSRHGVRSFIEMVAPEAYLEGFAMLNLGGFPGLVPGENRIRGEVHEYESLEVLDSIEGYRKDFPEAGLYNRRLVVAQIPEGEIEDCWVYTFNGTHGFQREADIIESGDWFKHRGYYEKFEEIV